MSGGDRVGGGAGFKRVRAVWIAVEQGVSSAEEFHGIGQFIAIEVSLGLAVGAGEGWALGAPCTVGIWNTGGDVECLCGAGGQAWESGLSTAVAACIADAVIEDDPQRVGAGGVSGGDVEDDCPRAIAGGAAGLGERKGSGLVIEEDFSRDDGRIIRSDGGDRDGGGQQVAVEV